MTVDQSTSLADREARRIQKALFEPQREREAMCRPLLPGSKDRVPFCGLRDPRRMLPLFPRAALIELREGHLALEVFSSAEQQETDEDKIVAKRSKSEHEPHACDDQCQAPVRGIEEGRERPCAGHK
eukprot:CAMPEP_0206059588 /NCGR_PEP_ID=MMETSP1466-20131121/49402_1 /ASSEMBLY_ACC=CAM_ASM_001126 /TAXON_ID=44452 /ORGANISM="Pavlova gyrans, Strain CCMP608" /LENGTH=126 /DNA_ID=CAMNT_0053434913 /DNA_START=96 /DNA_END=475 /DNA_ORIENTATION=-